MFCCVFHIVAMKPNPNTLKLSIASLTDVPTYLILPPFLNISKIQFLDSFI